MTEQDIANRIEDLETKLTFQEDTIQKLNDVIVTCQARVDEHATMIRMIMEQIRTVDQVVKPEDEPPPPHY